MTWWHDQAIYQIYPKSFQDTNGNGLGDLDGIRKRLAYLRDLDVGALWLSPVYPSPMKDGGYDVSDYTGIDPLFGDMAAFDRLLEEAHGHGLKLLMDFVPNHSSDQHPWFQEALKGPDNPKRDWYVWADPGPDGGPPNNWQSNFGGSAWTLDEASGQYYYHAFLPEQPDLNWRNPDVREAMYAAMKFWLDRGVDGFRVDVIYYLFHDENLPDNPPNPDWRPGMPDIRRYLSVHTTDQPEVHGVIEEMRDLIERYDDRLLIGEIYLPVERLVTYYGRGGVEGVHLPFNFQLIMAEWDAGHIADLIDEYEAALPEKGWPNWVLSNHDQPRIAGRVGEAQAKVAATLLLTLRGTPTLYYGDELGLGKVRIPDDRIQDPQARNEPDAAFNRDSSRTPMPWSQDDQAGFTSSELWLPLNEDWQTRNVAGQEDDPRSILQLYRKLLSLRKKEATLRRGSYRRLFAEGGVLAYERAVEGDRIGIVLNLTDSQQIFELSDAYDGAEILLSTYGDVDASSSDGKRTLRANEGLILRPHLKGDTT
jgi:alpha-glucosidase